MNTISLTDAQLRSQASSILCAGLISLGVAVLLLLLTSDGDWIEWAASLDRTTWGYQGLFWLSHWGLRPFYLLFIGLWLAWKFLSPLTRSVVSGYFIAQWIGPFLVVRLLKMVAGRTRPFAALEPLSGGEWHGFSTEYALHSFPSGHTADIVVSACFVSLLPLPGWIRGLMLWIAVLMGISRIVLLKHYPTDVLAGAVIGGVVCGLVVFYWVLRSDNTVLGDR